MINKCENIPAEILEKVNKPSYLSEHKASISDKINNNCVTLLNLIFVIISNSAKNSSTTALPSSHLATTAGHF